MIWLKRILWVLLGLAVLAGIAFAFRPRPVTVDLGTVRRGAFVQFVENEGQTRFRDRYVISAPVAGMQSRINLEVGDQIERSTVVAVVTPGLPTLNDPRTQMQLEQRLGAAEAAKLRADAIVARDQARLDQAKADLARTAALVDRGIAPVTRREQDELALALATRELEVAQFEAHMAMHEEELARSALALSRDAGTSPLSTEHIDLQSPIDGVVLKVFQENAGPVTLGAPLVEIGDTGRLEVVVDVLTTDAVGIQPGAAAVIGRWGGPAALNGVVRRVEPAGFTKVSALGVDEQRVNVILDITSRHDEWQMLGDAFRVEAAIEVFRLADALVAPTSALFRDGEGWAIYEVKDGAARKISVTALRRTGQETAIAGEIEPGTSVVEFPSDNLRDGISVVPRS